jgi:hypothetical protein
MVDRQCRNTRGIFHRRLKIAMHEFFNIADAQTRLKGLPLKVQKVVLRACARAGATIIRKQYKALLKTHRQSKSLEKALGVIVRLYKDGNVAGYAGVRRGKEFSVRGKRIVPAFYNHFLELGRKGFERRLLRKNPLTPFRNGKPRYIPSAAGQFLLAKAIAASKGAVQQKVETTFVEQMEKAFTKLNAGKA